MCASQGFNAHIPGLASRVHYTPTSNWDLVHDLRCGKKHVRVKRFPCTTPLAKRCVECFGWAGGSESHAVDTTGNSSLSLNPYSLYIYSSCFRVLAKHLLPHRLPTIAFVHTPGSCYMPKSTSVKTSSLKPGCRPPVAL